MPPLNRDSNEKAFVFFVLTAFLGLTLSFFFMLNSNLGKFEEDTPSTPSIQKNALEYDEPAYETWLVRYLEGYSSIYYQEIHTMHLKSESVRIKQHKQLDEAYMKLMDEANKVKAPLRYAELHDIMREEAWISSQMHKQYPLSYRQYQLAYFQKMKKRNQALLWMERQEPKLLFRLLIQEKAAFQANSLDK